MCVVAAEPAGRVSLPAPPFDPALSALGTALSADAMAELLAPRLGASVELRSCRPCYIRYKPGTNCLVQYRLALAEPGVRLAREVLAQVTLYADGRAERLWSRGSLQRLAARASAWNPEPPLDRVAHLHELAGIFQLYPVDVALPGLTFAASAAGRRRVLRRVLAQPAVPGCVELVRYKPARKALLRYPSDAGTVYAKLHTDDRGALLFRASRALESAGVATAAALAYLPSLRLLVQEDAPGRRLADLHGSDDFLDEARAAGAALGRFRAVGIPGLRVHTWADEAAALLAAAGAVAVIRPDLAAEAGRVAEQIIDGLGEIEPEPGTAHGDFSDDQVLVGAEGGPVLLDLDELRASHPLLDVGNFLAHLSVRDPDDPARASFVEGYGCPPPERLPLFESAGLLKLAVAPFRRLEQDWPEQVERRVRLAMRRLGERNGGRSPSPRRPRDQALPQLAVLASPRVLAPALEHEVYGQAVEIVRADVVRHKPGRRCLLRYELRIGSGRTRRRERVYGKTFASERGPRVFRTLRAITGARACGPDVAVSEPIAYIASLRLLLQREVEGVPSRRALLAGDEQLAAEIAEAVHRLHDSAVSLERRHGLEDELAVLAGRVAGSQAGCRARRCLALLEDAFEHPFVWRLRPVHRDFYHEQVLVGSRGLALIDFDDAAMSEPAVDVANFLAHLRLLALEEPSKATAIAAASTAFVARYGVLDAQLDPLLLRLLESATLLRLACIHEPLAGELIEESLERVA